MSASTTFTAESMSIRRSISERPEGGATSTSHAVLPSASDSAMTRPVVEAAEGQIARDDRLGRAAQRQLCTCCSALQTWLPSLARNATTRPSDRRTSTMPLPMAGAARISLLMCAFHFCAPVAASSATISP